MLNNQIKSFASACHLSKSIIDKSTYIITLLEDASSGLSKEKHNQLIECMSTMISAGKKIKITRYEIVEKFKSWSVDEKNVELDNAIFLSINHIAAAMQTTG